MTTSAKGACGDCNATLARFSHLTGAGMWLPWTQFLPARFAERPRAGLFVLELEAPRIARSADWRTEFMKTRKRPVRISETKREYDFSRGVRGKYARRFAGGAMIPGIQFLVDEDGEKTAVVIDLRKNSELWEDFYYRALARL